MTLTRHQKGLLIIVCFFIGVAIAIGTFFVVKSYTKKIQEEYAQRGIMSVIYGVEDSIEKNGFVIITFPDRSTGQSKELKLIRE